MCQNALLLTDHIPPAATIPFDPGYDPATVVGHLSQSGHRMHYLKLSMATWMIAAESSVREKIAAAHGNGVPTTAGGGPFEIAVALGKLPSYLALCADVGFDRIEAGEGFAAADLKPAEIVGMAAAHGLSVQYEIGSKHGGAIDALQLRPLIDRSKEWLDAGAVEIVLEGRESAKDVGAFSPDGQVNWSVPDGFVNALGGLETIQFETPDKRSQFAFIEHFGPTVKLSNVRLEEVLRVESYRLGLHADSFHARLGRPEEGS